MLKSISFLLLFLSFSLFAKANVYIKVGQANLKKSPIALPPFQYFGSVKSNRQYQKVGRELFNTLAYNLEVSTYFQFIRQEAFLEDTAKTALRPAPLVANGFRFSSWKKIGAEFLIRGGFNTIGSTLQFEAYVYYIPKAKLVIGKKYSGKTSDARTIAHTFANDILKALTGKEGMFRSKIVVASDKGGGKFKEIYIMDWDGKNTKSITKHRSISLSPNWSPDGKYIAYSSFAYHSKSKTRNLNLFLYEVFSGKRYLLMAKKGINSGATFSPDSKRIYFTQSGSGGGHDIVSIKTDGTGYKKILVGPRGAMNVEPALSSSARKMAFSSTRGGRPMIYISSLLGKNIQRRTKAGRYNASPSWSPDGKKIAFAGQDKGHFDIFIMNQDGTNLKRLTSARKPNGKWANNEDPSFSPDGRHIMFVSDRSGSNQIYIVNLDGTNVRRITFDKHNYFKPKWSKNF